MKPIAMMTLDEMRYDRCWKRARKSLKECLRWVRVALDEDLDCPSAVAKEIKHAMEELQALKPAIEAKAQRAALFPKTLHAVHGIGRRS